MNDLSVVRDFGRSNNSGATGGRSPNPYYSNKYAAMIGHTPTTTFGPFPNCSGPSHALPSHPPPPAHQSPGGRLGSTGYSTGAPGGGPLPAHLHHGLLSGPPTALLQQPPPASGPLSLANLYMASMAAQQHHHHQQQQQQQHQLSPPFSRSGDDGRHGPGGMLGSGIYQSASTSSAHPYTLPPYLYQTFPHTAPGDVI